jgi:hypothetical protein
VFFFSMAICLLLAGIEWRSAKGIPSFSCHHRKAQKQTVTAINISPYFFSGIDSNLVTTLIQHATKFYWHGR